MLPNKYEKQAQDYCEIDNEKSPFVAHIAQFKFNTHANMFPRCQYICKKRFKYCDGIPNTPVIKK